MEDGEATTIRLTGQPFDVDFHPAADIVAAGLITGTVELFAYGNDEPRRLWKSRKAHTDSCRAVRFINQGRYILSASPDRTILATDVETGKAATRLQNAHSAAINRLETLTESSVASGDDAGTVKVWDTRQRDCCATFSPHQDFISDMDHKATTGHLLVASGDGRLSVYNLRRSKVEAVSENAEDELLSIALVKNKHKVVCGTQGGLLLLYSWGHFEDCSDRLPGHPSSVDTIVTVDEDTLLTGSSDGLIRLVSILPNKMLGVVGEHMNYPIEQLALSRDREVLASASHEATLKLWNVAYLSEGGRDRGELARTARGNEGEDSAKTDVEICQPRDGNKSDTDAFDEGPSSIRGQGRSRKAKTTKGTKGDEWFFADL